MSAGTLEPARPRPAARRALRRGPGPAPVGHRLRLAAEDRGRLQDPLPGRGALRRGRHRSDRGARLQLVPAAPRARRGPVARAGAGRGRGTPRRARRRGQAAARADPRDAGRDRLPRGAAHLAPRAALALRGLVVPRRRPGGDEPSAPLVLAAGAPARAGRGPVPRGGAGGRLGAARGGLAAARGGRAGRPRAAVGCLQSGALCLPALALGYALRAGGWRRPAGRPRALPAGRRRGGAGALLPVPVGRRLRPARGPDAGLRPRRAHDLPRPVQRARLRRPGARLLVVRAGAAGPGRPRGGARGVAHRARRRRGARVRDGATPGSRSPSARPTCSSAASTSAPTSAS